MFYNMLLLFTTCLLFVCLTQADQIEYLVGENRNVDHVEISKRPPAMELSFKSSKAESTCAELIEGVQKKMDLKPTNLNAKKYIFLWREMVPYFGGGKSPFTSIIQSELTQKPSLKIAFDESATFVPTDYPRYIIDLLDGGSPIEGEILPLIDTSKICLKLVDGSPNRIAEARSRLAMLYKSGEKKVKLLVGGPYELNVEPRFLQWSSFVFEKFEPSVDLVFITGSIKDYEEYYIQENGAKETLYPGKLVEKRNGAWKFCIATIHDKQGVLDKINKIVFREPNYLVQSVLSISMSVSNHIKLPARKILHVTNVKAEKDNVVIVFKWLENQDGHSFTHVVKVEWNGPAYLPGVIYFNEGADTGGTVIVYPPKERESDGGDFMQSIYVRFLADPYQLQISGPWNKGDIKIAGNYDTLLTLTVSGKPILRGH